MRKLQKYNTKYSYRNEFSYSGPYIQPDGGYICIVETCSGFYMYGKKCV